MSQDNIFREIDEELRSDRMRSLWRRFSPFVIGGAIAVVALVAVNEGWTWYHTNNAAQSSDELYTAFDLIDGGDLAAAQTQLDKVIAEGSGNYPVLAQFRKAGVLAKEGKSAEAIAAYDTLSTTQSNQRLRELALVLAAQLMIDNGTLADVESRVSSLAVDGNPLRNAARETLGLAQYKAGNFDAAQSNFEAVAADPLADSSARTRMSYYIAALLAQGVVTQEAAPEAAPEAPAAETTENAAPAATTTEAEPAAQ
jgi:hypothetical protein